MLSLCANSYICHSNISSRGQRDHERTVFGLATQLVCTSSLDVHVPSLFAGCSIIFGADLVLEQHFFLNNDISSPGFVYLAEA